LKKIFRFLNLAIAFILLTYCIYLGVFHIKEYVKGNIYIEYLEKNKTIFNKDFQLSKDFYSHQLFMIGEIHGTAKSPELDFKLFKHINENTVIKYYMAEVDFSQAYFLNKYLHTGKEELLKKALKTWLVVQARGNKDYYQKWKNLYNYNKQLPNDRKITVLGSDVLSDFELANQHLKILLCDNNLDTSLFEKINNLESLVSVTNQYIKINNFNSNKELTHLFKTIIQTKDKGREAKIFDNFSKLIDLNKIQNQKIYMFYGFAHTLQEKLKNGFQPLAYRIKQSQLPMSLNLVSLNMCFQDSKMIIKSEGLPFYLKNGPLWSKLSLRYDSLLLFYLKGIKDLKRTSSSNTITFYKIDSDDSPYKNSNRLMDFTMILPFMKSQKIDILKNKVTSDYSNYIIFIRNSKAAQPYE